MSGEFEDTSAVPVQQHVVSDIPVAAETDTTSQSAPQPPAGDTVSSDSQIPAKDANENVAPGADQEDKSGLGADSIQEASKDPALQEKLDQAARDRDIEAATRAGREQFEAYLTAHEWTQEEIATLLASKQPFFPMLREAAAAGETQANPLGQAAETVATSPDVPPVIGSPAATANANAEGAAKPVVPPAEQPPLHPDQQTPPTVPPTAAETTLQTAPAAPEQIKDKDLLKLLSEKLLKLKKKNADITKLLDDIGVNAVERWGKGVENAIQNNFDPVAFLEFIATGEYYSRVAQGLGYEGASQLEAKGIVPIGPQRIEDHTENNPKKELALILEGMIESGVIQEPERVDLLKGDALEALKSVELKSLFAKLTADKDATHKFSKKVAYTISNDEKSDLTDDGLAYILKIPELPHTTTKEAPVAAPAPTAAETPVATPTTAKTEEKKKV